MKTIHTVFEKGVFRPLESVELPERTEVEFEPRPLAPAGDTNKKMETVYAILGERYQSAEANLAARDNEHQP